MTLLLTAFALLLFGLPLAWLLAGYVGRYFDRQRRWFNDTTRIRNEQVKRIEERLREKRGSR